MANFDEEDRHGDIMVQAKLSELYKVKDELKRAKDEAMQSWLDSKPLIDELEKQQSGLATAKNRTSMSNIVIQELESQLEAITKGIRTKIEEEIKATKITYELTQAEDQAREVLDGIKIEADAGRRERLKSKHVLRMKRQTLRTLQLTLRAMRLESEALRESKAEALRYISFYEADNPSTVVQLTKEEFNALMHRARDETSLADWRISVSMEQKQAAEASRALALSRLNELNPGNMSSRRKTEYDDKNFEDGHITVEEAEEEDPRKAAGEKMERNGGGTPFPKARAKAIAKSDRKMKQGSSHESKKKGNNKQMMKKKKKSVCGRMQIFFRRLFGG